MVAVGNAEESDSSFELEWREKHWVLPDWKLKAGAPRNQSLKGFSCSSSRAEVTNAYDLEFWELLQQQIVFWLNATIQPEDERRRWARSGGIWCSSMKSVADVAVRKESAPVSSPWPWFGGRWHWSRCWLVPSSGGCGRLSALAGSRCSTTSWRRRRCLWRGWPTLGFRKINKQTNSWNEDTASMISSAQ